MAKDQTQAQGKGKNGQGDEALAADTTSEGGSSRRRKGKCHHCGKDGHWVCECRTKKREEAAEAAAANRSGQPAQANTSTSTKPENRPVGYANAAFEDESDDGGFWAAAVDVACAYPDYTEPDPLMGEPEDDDVDEWEAFRAETWGAEDDEGSDRAGFGIQLVKEGEEMDVEEEAGAATLLEEDSAPRGESQPAPPAPHNALHTLTIGNDLVPCRALDEEGHTPQIGEGRPRTTSLCGGQVADTMRHAHHLHDVVRSPEFAHLDDPEPAIRAREGQSPLGIAGSAKSVRLTHTGASTPPE